MVPRDVLFEFAAETRPVHRRSAYSRGFFLLLVAPHGGNGEPPDSAGLVSLLFGDPEVRSINYRGDGSDSLSILFADRSFGCSQSRFESISLSREGRWAFRIRCLDRVLHAATIPHRFTYLPETPRPGRYLRFHDSSADFTVLDIDHGCDGTRICRIPADLAEIRSGGGSFYDEDAFFVTDALRRATKTAVKSNCYRRLGPAAFRLEFLSLQRRNRGNVCRRLLAGGGRGAAGVSPFEFLRCAGFGFVGCAFPAGMTRRKRPERRRGGSVVPVCAGKPRALLREADRGNGETEFAVEGTGRETGGSGIGNGGKRRSARSEAEKRGKRSGRGRGELGGLLFPMLFPMLLLFRLLLFPMLFQGEFQSRFVWKFARRLQSNFEQSFESKFYREFHREFHRKFERLLRGLYVFLVVACLIKHSKPSTFREPSARRAARSSPSR